MLDFWLVFVDSVWYCLSISYVVFSLRLIPFISEGLNEIKGLRVNASSVETNIVSMQKLNGIDKTQVLLEYYDCYKSTCFVY